MSFVPNLFQMHGMRVKKFQKVVDNGKKFSDLNWFFFLLVSILAALTLGDQAVQFDYTCHYNYMFTT